MPKITSEFTLGNLVSILTTLVMVGALVWHLSGRLSDLEGADKLHDQRIAQAEAKIIVSERDARDIVQKMARIEANTESQLRILLRLEQLVDRMRPVLTPPIDQSPRP